MNTKLLYSPHDLLPADNPQNSAPDESYFYNYVSKHFVKDVVRIMMNGIPIDLNKVKELEDTLEETIESVQNILNNNKDIQEYTKTKNIKQIDTAIKEQLAKRKVASDFPVIFKPKDSIQLSFIMDEICSEINFSPQLPILEGTAIAKWNLTSIKKHKELHPIMPRLVEGLVKENNSYVIKGLAKLSQHKADIFNRKIDVKIDNLKNTGVELFNPGSAVQKQELFSMLGVETLATSKTTGNASWNRDAVEELNKFTLDDSIKEITQAFIDHSFSAIVKNNFIKSFYKYTLNGRLHGNLRIFGAKSFRLTSNNPNLLNLPSTKSRYSKPVKKCLIAPPGKIVFAIDYGALEDRVIASLSLDENKMRVFKDNLDGHSLNGYGYFKDEIAKYMEITDNATDDIKKFFTLTEEGHTELKAIRQKGKPATFAMAYGAHPLKISQTLKISLTEAEKLFDNYHNNLYPKITEYREKYVIPTAAYNGKLHLGLGCYLKTDNADRDCRTLSNATCQFWSILTLLTINKMHQLIDKENKQNSVECVSTIYDSIYFIVDEDIETIKWVNDKLVPIMLKDFIKDQEIKNEAVAEIGFNWADMSKIPNNANTDQVAQILKSIQENKKT